MLQPFEKGKSLLDQAIPVQELLVKIGEALKEVDAVKKKVAQRS